MFRSLAEGHQHSGAHTSHHIQDSNRQRRPPQYPWGHTIFIGFHSLVHKQIVHTTYSQNSVNIPRRAPSQCQDFRAYWSRMTIFLRYLVGTTRASQGLSVFGHNLLNFSGSNRPETSQDDCGRPGSLEVVYCSLSTQSRYPALSILHSHKKDRNGPSPLTFPSFIVIPSYHHHHKNLH